MVKFNKKIIIAIDGMAATGKSVLAKGLAKKLNILYIDTGAMYRACGYFFISNNIEITKENVEKYIDKLNIKLEYEDNNTIVYLNGEDITNKIRTEEISMAASDISKIKILRDKLVDMQREMAKSTSVVLEGRDITSVVFPNADLKIYLTASEDIRTKRRIRDLEKKSGIIAEYDDVRELLRKRDIQDTTRDESPLTKVEDAIEIDTTNLTNDETVDMIIDMLKDKGLIDD